MVKLTAPQALCLHSIFRRLLLTALWALSLLVTPAARAGTTPILSLATEDYPPYHMQESDRVSGFVTDKVREMLARAGVAGYIKVLPWKRAYIEALRQSDHCVFSTTRTPEREKLFKWVGPLAHSDWVLYARAGHGWHFTRLEDAHPYLIGSYNGDVRDSYLHARGYRLDAAFDDPANLQKLLYGRIDLWVSDKYSANMLIRKNGLTEQIVPVFTFNRVKLYLACHRDTSTELLQRLSQALADMVKDGTAQRIERSYDSWSREESSGRGTGAADGVPIRK